MKKSMILIALLLAIVSVGAVFAADNDTNVTNNQTTDVTPEVNQTVDNTTSDDNPAGEITTNVTNTTGNVTNDTNVSAAGEPVKEPVKPIENTLAETGLPIVALVLVVLAAVGVYRRK